jgi:hypothetical protein
VLSMLKLDSATAAIPVVTYTISSENDGGDESQAESSSEIEHIALVMN